MNFISVSLNLDWCFHSYKVNDSCSLINDKTFFKFSDLISNLKKSKTKNKLIIDSLCLCYLINKDMSLLVRSKSVPRPLFYNRYTLFNCIRWFMTLLNEHNLVKVSNYSKITREVTPPDWIKVITILHLCEVECPYNLYI